MIDDPEIGNLRQQIDALDQKILELLCERLKVVHQVGEEKRAKGIAVYDPSREEKLLDRLVKAGPAELDEEAVRTIFKAIVSQSRRLESEMIGEK